MQRLIFVFWAVATLLPAFADGKTLNYPDDGNSIGAFRQNDRVLREVEVLDWLRQHNPGIESEAPELRELAWYLAAWAAPGDDGVRRLSRRYFGEGAANYNAVRRLAAGLQADGRPDDWLLLWRNELSRRLIRRRLVLDIDGMARFFASMPDSGDYVRAADGAELMQKIMAAYPDRMAAANDRKVWMDALAEVNPALTPRYWYRRDVTNAVEPDPHVIVGFDDGTARIYRYEWQPGQVVWLPPHNWLQTIAQNMPKPVAENSALSEHQTVIYETEVSNPWQNDRAITVRFLTAQGALQNAYALSGRVVLRVISIQPVFEPPEDDDDFIAKLKEMSMDDLTDIGSDIPVDLLHAPASGLIRPAYTPLVFRDGEFRGSFFIASGQPADGEPEFVFTIKGKAGTDGVKLRVDRNRSNRVTESREFETAVSVVDGDGTDPVQAEWPQWQGPEGSGSAGTDGPQVGGWQDARLAWVSDHPVPTGRGPDTRGAARRIDNRILSGGWASPMISQNTAIMYYYRPGGDIYAFDAARLIREEGERPDNLRLNLIRADDIVHAFDATSGKTLWRRVYAEAGVNWSGFNKSGPMISPAIKDGVVYAMGTLGNIYAVDLADGRTRWISDIGPRAEIMRNIRTGLESSGQLFTSRSDFACNVVVAGNVVVINDKINSRSGGKYRYEEGNGLTGLCAVTGRRLWRLPQVMNATGSHGTAVVWRDGANERILAFGNDKMYCIEPVSGEILWETDGVQGGNDALAVSGNIVVAHTACDQRKLAAWRLGNSGAEKLWELDGYGSFINGMTIHDGRVYANAREPDRVLVCVDLLSGTRLPVDGNGDDARSEVLNQGCIAAFGPWIITATSRGLRFYPAEPERMHEFEEVSYPLSAGYIGSLYPAIADGRVFIRTPDRLVCFDFRNEN